MRSLIMGFIVVVAGALTACGGQGADGAGGPSAGATTAATTRSATATSVSSRAAPTKGIPEGTWVKTMTAAGAKALGLGEHLKALGLGKDGKARVELRIAGSDYAQFQEDVDDEGMVLGDRGTGRYDEQGQWVLTSVSEGCLGCVSHYAWSVHGDRLTLRMVEVDSSGDPVDVLIGRAVMEGTFTRQ